MADQKSVTALQPFLLLAKGAGPAACADLIVKATEAPGCYVFGELLETPNIRKLEQSEEYEKFVRLLRIFAYGSYSDYTAQAATLPPLSSNQLHKLKQLSLITLASKSQSEPLKYAHLLSVLDIPDIRQLEDLVISAIYASLLEAKLDTARQTVEVSSAAGRDIAPGDIEAMIATMDNWGQQCESVLQEVETQITRIYDIAAERKKENDEYTKQVEAKKKKLAEGKGKRGMGGDGPENRGDEMELDDSGNEGQDGHRRRKRNVFGKKR